MITLKERLDNYEKLSSITMMELGGYDLSKESEETIQRATNLITTNKNSIKDIFISKKELNLSGNTLGSIAEDYPEFLQQLTAFIRENKSLQKLLLRMNGLSACDVENIKTAISQNRYMTQEDEYYLGNHTTPSNANEELSQTQRMGLFFHGAHAKDQSVDINEASDQLITIVQQNPSFWVKASCNPEIWRTAAEKITALNKAQNTLGSRG